MTTTKSRLAPHNRLARFVPSIVAILAGLAASTALAQVATFTLVDNTNLAPNSYQIYVTGFSTAGPYVLQQNGSWAAPTSTAGTLPCYRFPQDIQQIQINGTQTSISARVYYFVVTDVAKFPQCNPTAGNQGLFNLNPNGFTYTGSGASVTVPTAGDVLAKSFPAWTFSEIGTSATSGTIDLSQVDFFAFPMNMTATVTPATPPNPANPPVAGNPIGFANPADVINHASVRDAYAKYADTLAVAQGGACSNASPPAACEYKKLLRDITTGGSSVPLYVIQNPGGYVVDNPTSPLNGAFDGVINALWNPAAPPLYINTGGAFGNIPPDTFVSSYTTIQYPGVGANYSIPALVFTGLTSQYVAYVFSPIGLQSGCSNPLQIPALYCPVPATSGFQVFAAAGALGPPVNDDNFTLLNNANKLKSGTAPADYSQLVGRLGLLLSSAMNRGVARVNCPVHTWRCWQDETYWYPTTVSATFPDITQNLFSYWMHTAAIKGTPMFVQPPGAVQGATGTPGGGKTMGMAYGFAADENPTPQAVSPPQPEVPSKFDQTVTLPGSGTLTFGPWVTSSANPTLSVVISPNGGGRVTSTPAGIDCGATCSNAYAPNASVTLSATPAPGYVFSQWSGACTGTTTTCSVVVSATATAIATFTPTAPSSFGLTVAVNGPGTVGSAPAGISCGAACSASFAANSAVTLTASPAPGATFAGWSGACSGTALTCVVTMSAARSVGAAFTSSGQVALTVVNGGGGVVTTLPGAIDCGTTCVAGFAQNASVSVVATPLPGYKFTGWSGACTGTNVCDLVMDASKTVTATFTVIPVTEYALTVVDLGNGTIVSAPAGIDCGTVCANSFGTGTLVTLTATASPGNVFAGWGGACAGLGTCVVLMDQTQTVTATFLASGPPPGAVQVPTLSQWALMLLALLVALAGAAPHMRGRRR
ncbi:MAG: IPTL-CTERM sorting domain-containing protein [Burkholderiales bacterium]